MMQRFGQHSFRSSHLTWEMLLSVALAPLLTGCEDPVAREHIARREEHMSRTIGMMQDIDAAEPRAMGWTASMLAQQHEQDLQRSAENPGKVNAWILEDAQRFQEQQPVYQREIDDQLKGDPKKIEETVPDLLY